MLVGQPAARQMYISVQCRKPPLVLLHSTKNAPLQQVAYKLTMAIDNAPYTHRIAMQPLQLEKGKPCLYFSGKSSDVVSGNDSKYLIKLLKYLLYEWISKAAKRLVQRGQETPSATNNKKYVWSKRKKFCQIINQFSDMLVKHILL